MYMDSSVAALRGFEGAIAWMYVDTVGKVSVAVGRQLFGVKDAQALPFGIAGRLATPAEVSADYLRVQGMRAGMAASAYRCPTSPELDDATISAMLYAKVHQVDGVLRGRLSGYPDAPDPAKLALIDMAYNLGEAGLLDGFPHVVLGVETRNFKLCAMNCHRRGPNEARNGWTRDQFLVAAELAANGVAV